MFQIDVMSRVPVYEQIVEQMEQFVLTGILKGGDKLPSVRGLSVELSINPNTIQKAYSELDRRGMIYSVPGKGCFVNEEAVEMLSSKKKEQIVELERLIYELAMAGVTKEELINCVDKAIARKDGE